MISKEPKSHPFSYDTQGSVAVPIN